MTNKQSILAMPCAALKNEIFAGLYFAGFISELDNAFTGVGLALLSYQFGKTVSH
jgi:NRE family putative nickel resistance protein-like MFS transporter